MVEIVRGSFGPSVETRLVFPLIIAKTEDEVVFYPDQVLMDF